MTATRRQVLATLAAGLAAPHLVSRANSASADELRIGLAFEPSTVDPHFHNTTPNKSLARNIFEPLIFQDDRQRLVPGLATAWRALDATTWRFELRQGVTFHNGAPFTSADVVHTFIRAADVPNSPSSFGGFIKGKRVEPEGDHAIIIRTDGPQPQLPIDVSTFGIVAASTGRQPSRQDFNSGRAAIGTGAYRFSDYVAGERIVLAAHDGHWAGRPDWRRVIMRPILSDAARVAALLAGDVDVIEFVPTSDLKRLRADPRFAIASSLSNRMMYVHLDQFRDDSPYIKGHDGSALRNPLKDVRVRRALSIAINRVAICQRVMEGAGEPAGQFMPSMFFGTSPNLTPPTYDPARAKALLAEAGLPQGFRLTLHGTINRYPGDSQIVQAIAQMWTAIGVRTQVETPPAAAFFSRGSTGGAGGTPEFSAILAGWGSASGEASDGLRALVATFDPKTGLGASNRGRYSNPTLDATLSEALSTLDDDRRAALLAKAGEIAIGDAGLLPIVFFTNSWALRKGLSLVPRTDEYTLASSIRSG
ncbi:MAG: ABC transporter substrate-binding protein [Alphaproteobacteria bacterium]